MIWDDIAGAATTKLVLVISHGQLSLPDAIGDLPEAGGDERQLHMYDVQA